MTQKNFLYIHLLFKLIKTCIFVIIIVYQISSHLAKHFDEMVGLVSGSIKNMYLTQTFDSLSVSLGPGLVDVDENEGGEYATIFHTIIIKTRAYNFSHAQYMKSKRKIVLFTPFLIMYVHVHCLPGTLSLHLQ